MRDTMRNSARMHVSKSQASVPRRTCASAIFRLSGDLVRMVAAVLPAHSASAPPDVASRSSAARMSSTLVAGKSRSIAARRATILPSPAGSAKAASSASTDTVPVEPVEQRGKARRRDAMGGKAGGAAVGAVETLAGQRAIGAEFARQARQEPGGADVGKKADADFRHGERESGRRRRGASRAPTRRRRRP